MTIALIFALLGFACLGEFMVYITLRDLRRDRKSSRLTEGQRQQLRHLEREYLMAYDVYDVRRYPSLLQQLTQLEQSLQVHEPDLKRPRW